jgi:hypothetical protein
MNRKSLITCALLAAGVISQASAADPVVYLTGSTAFRSTVFTALTTAGRIFDAAPDYQAERGGGTSASGATYMVFHGNIGGSPVYIDCAWSGSDAGMASVANVAIDNDGIPLFGAPETWMKGDGTVASGYNVAQPTATELESGSHQGDIACADTSEASALPAIQTVALKPYGVMGVVTFTWVKNNNTGSAANAAKTAWSDLVNVSTYQLQALIANGALPADFFTGKSADNPTSVYLVGRNKGSGTRANMLDDTTYGLNTPVNQFSIGGKANLNGTPDGTLTLETVGDNGYESGGGVAAALGTAGSTAATDPFTSATGWIAIGYLGTSDAQKSGLTIANNWLTENGVAESDGTIETGQYSYWGYENLYGRPNIVNGTFVDTVAKKVHDGVVAQVGSNGSNPAANDSSINTTFMNCSKLTDFSFPTHN